MKIDRLLAILIHLLNHSKASASELADRFETSVRTIYRDMETLNLAGIPIISHQGAGGGFEIMEGFKINSQLFRQEEMDSMIIALEGLGSVISEEHIKQTRNKIHTLLKKSLDGNDVRKIQIDFSPWGNSTRFVSNLNTLREAVAGNRLIRFAYSNLQAENSVRTVEPQQLHFRGLNWYLMGYCRLKEDFRYFKITRIHELILLHDHFIPRPVGTNAGEDQWRQKTVNLKVRLAPSLTGRGIEIFGEQNITRNSDGSLIGEVSYPEDEWVYSMLLGLGPDATVLAPESVRKEVGRRCRLMAEIYS